MIDAQEAEEGSVPLRGATDAKEAGEASVVF
jgi:hypothetical protein